MESIFRYPGGKTRASVRGWILSHRPAVVGEYREPFVGGGGVFFALRDVERCWVNDIHPGLMAVYEALRDRPAEFIAACKAVDPPRPDDPVTEPGKRDGAPTNRRLKEVFDRVAFDERGDQAFRYFFVNRTVFGGRVNYDIPSRLYFSNPDGWNIVATDRLERAAERLRDVRVTCGSYLRLLTEPGKDVWVYCDPPYVVNTGMTRTSQLYQHGFTTADHERFAAAVKASRHKVAVSYDDDEGGFVRSLFPEKDFRVVEASWAYCGTTNAEKERGKELLILNYDPPRSAAGLFADLNERGDLSEPETCDLASLETAIERCRRSFVQAGLALQAIRDRRLYRADFGTFEEYCQRRWGMARRYANLLVQAAEVTVELGAIAPKTPESEGQARELTRLRDADSRAKAWRSAVAEAEARSKSVGKPVSITAALVRRHVAALLPPPPDPPPPDWQKALRLAWGAVPAEHRDEAREWILNTLLAEGSRS